MYSPDSYCYQHKMVFLMLLVCAALILRKMNQNEKKSRKKDKDFTHCVLTRLDKSVILMAMAPDEATDIANLVLFCST